jgi:hypothetical protein
MTLKELRDQTSRLAVNSRHFAELDSLIAWFDRELIPERGAHSEAPRMIWDDDGMLLHCIDGKCMVVFGGRQAGRWFAVPEQPAPKATPPEEQAE